MQGITSGLTNLFPQDAADQITEASGRLGYAQGRAELKKKAEREAKKKRKGNLLKTAAIIGAAALTGGAAAALAPAALGAGAAGAAGAAGTAGAAGAAGTAAAGGGFLSGLSTFGSGALGALTGSGSVAAGTGGLAGALSTGAGVLGSMGTNMLMSSAMGGGGGGGMGGGEVDMGQAAMGALGSYMKEVQSANKTSRVLEGTLKDPAVRSAIYGPNFNDQQSSAVMEYANTLGAVDKAAYLQQALPGIARQSAATTDFARQVQMQNLRNEPTYARGMAELAGSRGGGGYIPLPPVDFTQFGGLSPAPRQPQNYGGAWDQQD